MVANIPFNYVSTTNAAGAFTIDTSGGVQGTMYDDPAARWALRSGVVATGETLPMWGGVGVYELVPNLASGNPAEQLGSVIGRAGTLTQTSAGGLSGFALFNQAYNAPITPQSPVPMAGSGMTFNYVRLGSGARIFVAADPALVSLEGGLVGANVSWDFNNQRLQPYDASTATISISSATWAATAGGQMTLTVAAWTGAFQPVAGDVLNVSGQTNTGTGGAAAVNGNFTVVSATATTVVLTLVAASGVVGTIGGSGLINFGTGALACRVDRILPGNSLTVSYNPSTGYATWNYAGTTAVITI
ncbi:MAG TPA: hypothetical protein VGR40_05960 [Candidatus Binatus sp.]|nr:hypothetical protein [Candidatus Binatus sp.]HEV2303157.1 hypothetical protein [Stellaceae bacterium]